MNRFVKDAELDVLYYRRITDARVKNKRIKASYWKIPNSLMKNRLCRSKPSNSSIARMKET